ncbi:hypothetical protein DFH11DRAFT_1668968 [Phellopilus nigrolimitatus]|nr:hypothetical protein DFH11DRAFT_1668968 [Phellopilus nigrolimitatus]
MSTPPSALKPVLASVTARGTAGHRSGFGHSKAKRPYSMALPRLPAPASTHYSGLPYDTHAVPSPTSLNFAVVAAAAAAARATLRAGEGCEGARVRFAATVPPRA